MIQLSINTSQLNTQIKAVTTASEEQWGAQYRRLVEALLTAYCLVYATGVHVRDIWRRPLVYWRHYTDEPVSKAQSIEAAVETVAPPVQAPPKKTTRKPRSAKQAEVVITAETTPTPRKTRRASRRTKAASTTKNDNHSHTLVTND